MEAYEPMNRSFARFGNRVCNASNATLDLPALWGPISARNDGLTRQTFRVKKKTCASACTYAVAAASNQCSLGENFSNVPKTASMALRAFALSGLVMPVSK
jgi:hypothetical protein